MFGKSKSFHDGLFVSLCQINSL